MANEQKEKSATKSQQKGNRPAGSGILIPA
jgi:hypothetical protein